VKGAHNEDRQAVEAGSRGRTVLDPAVNVANIGVEVADHVVTLSGHPPS
jgi:hypothetical protein